MAPSAKDAMGGSRLKVVADRGYFSGPEIRACDLNDMSAYVPKPLTSASRKKGLFTKADFVYVAKNDVYRCPAGERAILRFTTVEYDMNLRVYWPSACPRCPMKERCSPSDYRRIRRWEHENILEAMQRRLDRKPDVMTIRRSTVEHVFGTLKHWMGPAHFLTRTLGRVSTEMSLQVLAYNLKRVMNILGVAGTMKAMKMVRSGHFKCNLHRIADYPNLSAYTRDIYQLPGVAETVNFDHIKRHYYESHRGVNPTGIVPLGPVLDFFIPHDRARFAPAK
ncbi:hypothetical protein OKW28_004693 [Paraburkholderia sp. 40]